MKDYELFDLQLDGLWRFYGVMADASPGARIVDLDGVRACVVPRAPNRSVCNGVVYRDAAKLEAALDRLTELYTDGWVNAWTIWVPANDTATAQLLERSGHKLDAAPEAMGVELDSLDELLDDQDPRIKIDSAITARQVGGLNDRAYNHSTPEFESALESTPPDLRLYGAALDDVATDGDYIACAATVDNGSDCVVVLVATDPRVRGRGLASALMRQAMLDARERGLSTTTLQATKTGRPIYKRLGYRDLGAMQMWERRATSA